MQFATFYIDSIPRLTIVFFLFNIYDLCLFIASMCVNVIVVVSSFFYSISNLNKASVFIYNFTELEICIIYSTLSRLFYDTFCTNSFYRIFDTNFYTVNIPYTKFFTRVFWHTLTNTEMQFLNWKSNHTHKICFLIVERPFRSCLISVET